VVVLLMNVLQRAEAFTYHSGQPMVCKDRCRVW
jgi:hypothetical protein